MKNYIILILLTSIVFSSCVDEEIPSPEYKNPFYELPEQTWGGLYHELQLWDIVDHKDIADAIPKRPPADIYNDLRRARNDHDFDMRTFLHDNFDVPVRSSNYRRDTERSIEESADLLWNAYRRPPDAPQSAASTLIPLPHAYYTHTEIDNDVKYWPAYFTMLGLKTRGDTESLKNMLDNFVHLIELHGFIPYNNRTYNTSRSHFPFFLEMIELLDDEENGENDPYILALETEYDYWMKHAEALSANNIDSAHVVSYEGQVFNRFWDDQTTPRPEYYRGDDRSSNSDWRPGWATLREFRAITESGWNYASRYLSNGRWRGSTFVTHVLPVDLNATMYAMEYRLAEFYRAKGNDDKANNYRQKADARKNAFDPLFWDSEKGIYKDFHFLDSLLVDRETLATVYPLYFNMVSKERADSVALFIENNLLKEGGVMTSTSSSRQRWDGPNGFPHLQWVTYKALKNYGRDDIAQKIAERWVNTVERTYNELGQFIENYNVEEISENFDQDRDSLNYSSTLAVYETLKNEIN